MGGILVLVVFGLLALSAANGGCVVADGDGDFDFGVSDEVAVDSDGLAVDGDNLATCDGVVVVAADGGAAQVPGETGLFDTSESIACEMEAGQGDEDAVVVLQNALVRCNGQTVAVDGEYGPETTSAVIAVQRQAGVAADGAYGPATLQAMRWPTTASTTSGAAECARVSPVADAESSSASLPTTG
jgi:peptidoglycan hydrolase-like protein with peptidoglycan-binding domain